MIKYPAVTLVVEFFSKRDRDYLCSISLSSICMFVTIYKRQSKEGYHSKYYEILKNYYIFYKYIICKIEIF